MEKKGLASEYFIKQITTNTWKYEMEQDSSRYHFIGAWAAIIFDPLFAITDYFNISNNWKSLFLIRIAIALTTLLFLALRKKLKLPSHVVVLVPFLLISLQNAYTYSLIDNEVVMGHNLNYIALFIGGAMFILWDWKYSFFVILISAVSGILFFLPILN